MKIFLSWSGQKSHKVALAFKKWLPNVIQLLEPYVSSEDIDKGSRWSTDISKELEDSSFGILCVTRENMDAPWVVFEAGALSKKLDKTFVCPFLIDVKRSEVNGPLLQFQSTVFEKDDIHKLLKTLNKSCSEEMLQESRLDKIFEVWYPNLEEELKKIEAAFPHEIKIAKKEAKQKDFSEILEDILDTVRTNQKILKSPDSILPHTYIREILRDIPYIDNSMSQERMYVTRDLMNQATNIRQMMEKYKTNELKVDDEFELALRRLFDIIEHIFELERRSRRRNIRPLPPGTNVY